MCFPNLLRLIHVETLIYQKVAAAYVWPTFLGGAYFK